MSRVSIKKDDNAIIIIINLRYRAEWYGAK